jgi:hypothetical protein
MIYNKKSDSDGGQPIQEDSRYWYINNTDVKENSDENQ